LGSFSASIPSLLYALGVAAVICAPIIFLLGWRDIWDSLMLAIGGGCLVLVGFVCSQVRNAVLDRVLAILILGVFLVSVWAAFEQAGNVLNLWADKNTNRYLWKDPVPPEFPPKAGMAGMAGKEVGKAEEAERPDIWTRFSTMFTLKPPREGDEGKGWG